MAPQFGASAGIRAARREPDRSGMTAAVGSIFALLGDAVAAHEGVLSKRIGDAAQAAFPAASDAVAAGPMQTIPYCDTLYPAVAVTIGSMRSPAELLENA